MIGQETPIWDGDQEKGSHGKRTPCSRELDFLTLCWLNPPLCTCVPGSHSQRAHLLRVFFHFLPILDFLFLPPSSSPMSLHLIRVQNESGMSSSTLSFSLLLYQSSWATVLNLYCYRTSHSQERSLRGMQCLK